MKHSMKVIVASMSLFSLVVAATAFADGAAHTAAHQGHGEDASGHHGHGDHVPHFADINWYYGMVGEKDGIEPGFFFRPTGMPVPLGALILNTAVLFFLIGRFGGPAISSGLKRRKTQIAGDIERASQMKEEAEKQLAHYESQLSEMAAEMDRIKSEMRQQAESERTQVFAEAKERALALEAEAKQMIEQQLAHARDEAIRGAVTSAIAAARSEIEKALTAQDQERLSARLLTGVKEHLRDSEVRA